jgi:hypothetical protein
MVFTIDPEQFTAHVPLTVTAGLTVPNGLDNMVESRKIVAYEDAICAEPINEEAEGPVSSGQAEFVLWIPSIYEKVYLRQEIEVDGYPYYGYGREVGIDSDTPATEGFNEVYYAIGVDSPMNNGAVAPYGAMGLSDTEIRLTVTPNTGFALKNGTLKYHKGINDYDITGTDPDYSFTMPASDVTISAFFNRRLLLDFIAIEGPSDLMVPVTITHSAGTTSTDISWLDKETLTFTVDADYSKEAGNLKWLVNGKELSATGSSLTISAQTYVLRRYTLTVMIKEDDQWYSGEQSFTVTK